MQPARRLASYADLLALPDGARGELIDGAIISQPAPRPRHAKVAGALRRFVGGPFDDDDGFGGPGGWWIFLDVDVSFGTDVLRPDVAGWRRERLREPDVRPIDVIPDWVCEVLSPSNEAHDRVTKLRLYREHGVAHYWIVDPEARTLETATLTDGRWIHEAFDDGAIARVAPFEAVELSVGRLFLPKTSS